MSTLACFDYGFSLRSLDAAVCHDCRPSLFRLMLMMLLLVIAIARHMDI